MYSLFSFFAASKKSGTEVPFFNLKEQLNTALDIVEILIFKAVMYRNSMIDITYIKKKAGTERMEENNDWNIDCTVIRSVNEYSGSI